MVRQRLRPERIDLEPRRLERAAILAPAAFSSRCAGHAERHEDARNADPISRSRLVDHRLTNFCTRLPS